MFKGIPSFSPEHFRYINNLDPMKSKQLAKGIDQLMDEGVAQLFILEMNGRKIIGTVGALQFEVIQYRLEHEYGAKCSYENLNIYKACWVETDSKKNKEFIDFKKLKSKSKLIYFDEFQVTNIVDAMILGSLFKKIFDENIKVLFTSNAKLNDLYKDGLQRDQFLPFIKIMKERCFQAKLIIEEDYRKSLKNKNERYFFPLNETINFKLNKFFRKITKNLSNKEMTLIIKSRKFIIKNYFNGIARFDFKELCSKNIGAEDYIKIAEVCNFIVIENIPIFNIDNSNQQQRFITLIDILYEKNIPLMISSQLQLDLLSSSEDLKKIFKRTISRLYELTSIKYNKL